MVDIWSQSKVFVISEDQKMGFLLGGDHWNMSRVLKEKLFVFFIHFAVYNNLPVYLNDFCILLYLFIWKSF